MVGRRLTGWLKDKQLRIGRHLRREGLENHEFAIIHASSS
jgi:chromosome condensin MukBEF MukE localization factor